MIEVSLPLAAMRRTATDLEASYAPRPCDSEGLSNCSRCLIVALSRHVLRLVEALPEDALLGVERRVLVEVAPMEAAREEARPE